MYDFDFIYNARQQLLNSHTIIDWTTIAKKWLDTF